MTTTDYTRDNALLKTITRAEFAKGERFDISTMRHADTNAEALFIVYPTCSQVSVAGEGSRNESKLRPLLAEREAIYTGDGFVYDFNILRVETIQRSNPLGIPELMTAEHKQIAISIFSRFRGCQRVTFCPRVLHLTGYHDRATLQPYHVAQFIQSDEVIHVDEVTEGQTYSNIRGITYYGSSC